MTRPNRPARSLLFTPASRPRALAKIAGLACDGVIVDLEDAVGAAEKTAARGALVAFGRSGAVGPRRFLVRVNAPGTPWFKNDLTAALTAEAQGIVLPKASSARDIAMLAQAMDAGGAGTARIWAMIETARGVLNVAAIAAADPRMAGLILGPNDLSKDLQAEVTTDRPALVTSMGLLVLAARAQGLICLDGVYNAFGDAAGFEWQCEQGRALGFDGKTLIHPSQIAAANAAYGPTEARIDRARRMIAAFQSARDSGAAMAVFEGEMIEELHITAAEAVLRQAQAIADIEKDIT